MNNCPCNDCICLAICRPKQYPELVRECSLIVKYLTNPFDYKESVPRKTGRLKIIQKSLKPTMWTLIADPHGKVMVDNNTGYKECHFYY